MSAQTDERNHNRLSPSRSGSALAMKLWLKSIGLILQAHGYPPLSSYKLERLVVRTPGAARFWLLGEKRPSSITLVRCLALTHYATMGANLKEWMRVNWASGIVEKRNGETFRLENFDRYGIATDRPLGPRRAADRREAGRVAFRPGSYIQPPSEEDV